MPRSAPIARKDAFFGLHFDLHPQETDTSLGADISEDNIRDLLDTGEARLRPIRLQGPRRLDGLPDRGRLGQPGHRQGQPGRLAEGHPRSRRRLFIHYSGVWDSKAIEEHPDWARVGPDGKRDPNATSVFGPYVDELLIPQLKEVAAKYGLDGVWADGECWAAQLDYSPAALAAWTKETGFKDAPKDRTDPRWLEWKMFHRRAFERYLAHWVDAVHAANPRPPADLELDVHDLRSQAGRGQARFPVGRLLAVALGRPGPRRGPLPRLDRHALGPHGLGL